MRLLYVEDEPGVAMMTQALLETEGFEVEHAANGREALAKFTAGQPAYDLVLTDDLMPEIGGIQLVKGLREHGFTKKVVVYSGVVDTAKARIYRSLGVSAIVHKLDPLDQLVGALRSAAQPAT